MTGSSDSFRNVTKYLGQDYRFAPAYLRKRDPTSPLNSSIDVKPPEQQGYYPIGSLWLNTVNNRVFILVNIVANKANWVLLNVSVNQPVVDFIVDASTPPGTNPVLADGSGNVTVTGGQVGPGVIGANVIRTDSLFANTFAVEIQQTSVSAAVNTTLNGVAHFNSAEFTNNQGFISLIGGGASITQLTGNDGIAVIPTAGNINVLAAVVLNGTDPAALYVKRTAVSTETIDVQVTATTTSAAKSITKAGLASFDSAAFLVDAPTGFVSLVGGSGPVTLGLVPDANTAPGTTPVVPNGAGNIVLEGGSTFVTNTRANPIRTNSLAANTIDFQIQLAGSNPAVFTANKLGVAEFDSNQFDVAATGFVQLKGGGVNPALTKLALQTGTTPVVPDATGQITLNGAVVAPGTNPIRTDGTGANTAAIEVQISQALAAADVTKIGLSNFDSSKFTVAATGFVSLNGASVGQTITGQSGGALSPTVGNWNIFGAVTAAGTSPVVTSGAVSTLTVNVQTSQALAAADATKIGLSNFDSSSFAVAATGFVTLSTTGVLKTLTGNTGGAISPTANNINTLGTGSITIAGAGSTLTTQLTGLTLNAIQVGAGTATLTQLGPVNRAVLTSGATGIPAMTALAVDGQLIIGSTAGAPAAATLTAGTGITITNGSNSITIAATAGGFTWTDVTTATQALLAENGYITDRGAGVVYTLPASGVLGDEIKIVGKLGITTITPNANQQILLSSASGTVGVTGTVVGTNVGDCIDLICITAGASTVWRAANFVGNWTVN